ncbi:hypothetical protein PMIN03_003316 [Paraphaeosphaeria minitans]
MFAQHAAFLLPDQAFQCTLVADSPTAETLNNPIARSTAAKPGQSGRTNSIRPAEPTPPRAGVQVLPYAQCRNERSVPDHCSPPLNRKFQAAAGKSGRREAGSGPHTMDILYSSASMAACKCLPK